MANLYDLTRDELAALLDGEPGYRVAQLAEGLYAQARPLASITNVPKALRAHLEQVAPPALTLDREVRADDGATDKALFRLPAPDGARIESVLMRYPDRATVCVSTQAGCAMGCGFCATGQAGFTRHLRPGEIVEQVLWAMRRCHDQGLRLDNVVFMGMGEPLANYDATWAAVERIHAEIGLSARHLTVSTVGIVPGIRRLAAESLPVNLAVSLHAGNDELRDELVPVNRRYPLDQLLDACRRYRAAKGRRLSLEWALIAGRNDRGRDAVELAHIARELRAHVNLIPLNPTPGFPTRGTEPAGVARFRERLAAMGVNVTVRDNRGTDIDAACGQLAAPGGGGRRRVPVTLRRGATATNHSDPAQAASIATRS